MNRRTALKTLSLLGFTALSLRAQSLSSFIGGPDLLPLTRHLFDLPPGDWEIYIGLEFMDRVCGNVNQFPEQVPAREGDLYHCLDPIPLRLDLRRHLVLPHQIKRVVRDEFLSSPNPEWAGAPFERVCCLLRGPAPTLVEFLVARETLEVEAYRLPKIV